MERMLICKDVIGEIFTLVKEENNLSKDFTIDVFQANDEDFCFLTDEDRLCLPYYLNIENDSNFRKVILNKYNFDVLNYYEELTKEQNDLVFSLLHELGHMVQMLELADDFEDYDDTDFDLRCEILENYEDEYEREIAYRNLNSEEYADQFAINMINKYKNRIVNIIKNSNVNEVSVYGEFFSLV